MAYCRFSSEDFQSDVYVYADVNGGWTTIVAARRPVLPDAVRATWPAVTNAETAVARSRAISDWLNHPNLEYTDLRHLPSSGAQFRDPTPAACAARLFQLRAEGFNVPQYAIDDLLAEARADD